MGNFIRGLLTILIVAAVIVLAYQGAKLLIPEQTRTGLEGAD